MMTKHLIMKNQIKHIFIFLIILGLTQRIYSQPIITSFVPTSGAIGATVTITGANFNSTLANNVVFFGATKANISSASATSLTVFVPFGATYQNISVTDITTNLTAYSVKPFIVIMQCEKTIDTNSFAPKVDFVTGAQPYYVSICDIDGDGKSDLSIANAGSGTVSLYRNTSTIGTISFATKIDFICGNNSYCVSLGDLNGDGKPDMVIANDNVNTISVFKNTSTIGSISFATKVDYTTGSKPTIVAIDDFNCDGKPDLAVSNCWGNTISVFKNIGTGGSISFATRVDYISGLFPLYVSTSDLDGDGKPDIVSANYNSNTISIFKNTSSITSISFGAKTDFPTGLKPSCVSIGDLNGDGKPDLSVTNSDSDSLSILRNTSTGGSISFASKIDYCTGTTPMSVSTSDLNGDGNLDLAVVNDFSFSVSVFENISIGNTISFNPKVNFTCGFGPISIAIGDLDGDGNPDIATANGGISTTSVLINQQCTSDIFTMNEKKLDVEIFPNPFNSRTTISFNKEINNSTIKIVDVLGKDVKCINFSGKEIIIERGAMNTGIYIIQVILDKQIIASKKLMIH
jgi:hypothetical protein